MVPEERGIEPGAVIDIFPRIHVVLTGGQTAKLKATGAIYGRAAILNSVNVTVLPVLIFRICSILKSQDMIPPCHAQSNLPAVGCPDGVLFAG
jgi:hypothetical protein